MKVNQSELVEILVDCGVDSAGSWSADELLKRISKDGGIARYLGDGEAPKVLVGLWDQIVAAQSAGDAIEIVPTTAAPAPKKPAAKKPAAKPAGKKPAAKAADKPAAGKKPAAKVAGKKPAGSSSRYDGHATFPEWVAYLKKNPKDLPPDGVLATVVSELKAAGKGAKPNPITKDFILSVLTAKFPERDRLKMETNLENNVPSRLQWMYGIYVWSHKEPGQPKGYYIKGDGKTPQPKPVAKVKAKKVTAKAK